MLGPEGTARRLGESIAVLSRATIDVPERHRSLRATIAWSYDLLEEEPRAVFRALSLHPAGATLEALEATCDPSIDVPAALEQLLDAGLVRSHPTPVGEPRFSMLQTIRAFALTLFEDEQAASTVRERQLAYLLAVLREAHRARIEDPAAYARMVTGDDRDNIRAVLTFAARRVTATSCSSSARRWASTGVYPGRSTRGDSGWSRASPSPRTETRGNAAGRSSASHS